MRRMLQLLLAAVLALSVSGAGPFSPGADVEANRRMLRDLRETDPGQFARLERNYERFRALGPEQQQRLRDLDREIHELDPATQARLLRVLGEYGSWLSRLPEADRQRIQAAGSSEGRLAVVRELKEEQWVRRLPSAQVQQWKKADDATRKRLVEQWRQDERSGREEWAEARRWEVLAQDRPMMPLAQETFRKELNAFLEKRLAPMLTAEERQKLWPKEAEARRFPSQWLRAVADLADAHPVLALEPKYTKRADLPDEYRLALDNPPRGTSREMAEKLPEGRWPEYPIAVTRLMKAWKVDVKTPLGPAKAADFNPAVVAFVAGLQPADQEKLKKAENKWPDYPLMLHEIARERKLTIPDLSLPGDARMWESVRSRSMNRPDPPDDLLRAFVFELNRREPNAPRLSLQDPIDRETIKRRFNETYPNWPQRPPMPSHDRFRGGKKP